MKYESSGWYYAVNGSTNKIIDSFTSTNASYVFESAWSSMSSGGKIAFSGAINLGSNGLIFPLTTSKNLLLEGIGKTSSCLIYAGTGYAITLTPSGTLGYYYYVIQDFSINCSTVTTGRNGILIDCVGRQGVLRNINIDNVDYGVYYKGTNAVRTENVRVNVANVAYQTIDAPAPAGDTNELTFIDCDAIWSYNYCYNISGGSAMNWYGGSIAPRSGTGINLIGSYGSSINGIHFEAEGDCQTFINITGTSSSFPSKGISINDCYFNAHNHMSSAITIQFGDGITIRNPTSQLSDNSLVYLYNQVQNIQIDHPISLDPYLLDGESATSLTSRISGSVTNGRASGIIVKAGEQMGYGTVVKLTQNGVAYNITGIEALPMAVMYGQAANKPVVIATSGVTQAYCRGAVTWGHILTGSGTNGQGLDYEAGANDTRKILGYALETTAGDGLVWFKVNG